MLDNSRPVLCVIVSHATRENSQTCRVHAVIGRQWLSLWGSRQWAWTARGRVTDRAPTMTVWALRDDAGPQNDADGWGRRKRLVQNDVTVQDDMADLNIELAAWRPWHCNSPSAKSPTAIRKHSALLAVLRLLLVTAFLLYVHPPSMLIPFGYSALVPAVSPYP